MKLYFILYCFFHKEIGVALLRKIGVNKCYNIYLLKQKILSFGEEYQIISIDFMSTWICHKLLIKKTIFLSLEIDENDPFTNKIDKSMINAVIIQTKERYAFIFGTTQFPTFYIQNAPIFIQYPTKANDARVHLVFCGTALKGFGIISCLNFLKKYNNYTMAIKGFIPESTQTIINESYSDLVSENRLIFDTNYVEQAELNEYLHKYRIGFCFYDTNQPEIAKFNYRTAPSGKLFQYYASGIPVIASDLPGLNSIEEFKTGIMVKDLEPETLSLAINKIEANYFLMSQNCFKAAGHFDFKNSVKDLIDYLQKD